MAEAQTLALAALHFSQFFRLQKGHVLCIKAFMKIRFSLSSAFKALTAVAICSLFVFHAGRRVDGKPKETWKDAYWVWAGESPAVAALTPPLIYADVSGRQWPKELPKASEYMLVFRIEPGTPLDSAQVQNLTRTFERIVAEASPARIVGLQIDYDSPTGKLRAYARFLALLRGGLPSGTRLSITALLDWFTPRTSIADVLESVDEFVPQFYDVGPSTGFDGIAAPIDADKWADVFNSYRTPYRIGIATFGRISRRRSSGSGENRIRFFRDASALDFAMRADLPRTVETTPAGEVRVRYGIRQAIPDEPELQPGDTVEITFPSIASVRDAYQAARRFDGFCAGVVFFRWPTQTETVTLAPDDVQRIVSGELQGNAQEVEARDGVCLERLCADLYLRAGATLYSEQRTIRVSAENPPELFLSQGPLYPRLRNSQLIVDVPPFAGLGPIPLGRVISSAPLHFEVAQ